MRDGRTFWGIVGVIYCLAAPSADVIAVEQPDTLIPRFYRAPEIRVRPSFYGDEYGKPINLFVHNWADARV